MKSRGLGDVYKRQAQHYTNRYHKAMEALNVLPPSIEPHATGHIIEQEQLVKQIMDNGYAYESNGSIYFDVAKYDKDHKYGILSGRNLTDIINNSRQLAGTAEKRNQADFALWKKAMPEHIMLSLIHISEPTRLHKVSRMPSYD